MVQTRLLLDMVCVLLVNDSSNDVFFIDDQYGYKGYANYDVEKSYPLDQYPYAYEQEPASGIGGMMNTAGELPMKTVPVDLDQSGGNGEDMITHWVKDQQQG